MYILGCVVCVSYNVWGFDPWKRLLKVNASCIIFRQDLSSGDYRALRFRLGLDLALTEEHDTFLMDCSMLQPIDVHATIYILIHIIFICISIYILWRF